MVRIQRCFAIRRVALVGDRGMITTTRIRNKLEPANVVWISALKVADLSKLARALARQPGDRKPPQPALAPDTPRG